MILIGKDLLINPDEICYADLSAKDKDGKSCVKIKMKNGVEWICWAELSKSIGILKSLATINDQFELLQNIRYCVLKNRLGRESSVSKEIKELMNL